MSEALNPSPSEGNTPEWPTFKCTKEWPLRRDPKSSPSEKGHDLWLLTLSDLLLLLVVFFVLLFGLTLQQNSQASSPPREETRATLKMEEEAPAGKKAAQSEGADSAILKSLETDLLATLGNQEGREKVEITRHTNHVALTFPERIAFDPGQAQIKPSCQSILREVATLASVRPDLLVEVQGHTDDRPINNKRYASNWELSVDRATQVVKALIRLGINPIQISGRGFGEYRSLYPNDSDANRRKNRRVEIQISLPPRS
jgi:chemotaxis protein MotB